MATWNAHIKINLKYNMRMGVDRTGPCPIAGIGITSMVTGSPMKKIVHLT
jgi:hypothetical protein